MNTLFKLTLAAVVCCPTMPALAGPCDDLSGDLKGMCNAYCVAKQCGTPSQKGSNQSCDVLQNNYMKQAGSAPPCTGPTSSELSICPSTIGLKASGNPRTFTITNIGSASAVNVGYTATGVPDGTNLSSSGCSSIAPGGSCTITITPGATPSAAPGDVNPASIGLSISGNNTNTLNATSNIVTFGSVYQSGYVFMIDDSTQTACTSEVPTASIGGKVAALENQAEPNLTAVFDFYPEAIKWSSKADGTVDESIVGTTTSCPDQGRTDGQCNSAVILAYYTTIDPSLYAAGRCDVYSGGGYNDWYLPAICEMGPTKLTDSQCAPGIPNMADNLAFLREASCTGEGCLAGFYWSSTEDQLPLQTFHLSWSEDYSPGINTSTHQTWFKKYTFGVRCTRALNH